MPPKRPSKSAAADYHTSVFINCPFDGGYERLFEATVFTVFYSGYFPRCALEIYNSGQVRIEKIFKLIESCQFGIHDISRTELDADSKLPRFNMPLELGMFSGAQRFGAGLSDAWKVDPEKGQAILGPMKVSFYKLANGGFSPGFYNRPDGRSEPFQEMCIATSANRSTSFINHSAQLRRNRRSLSTSASCAAPSPHESGLQTMSDKAGSHRSAS